MWAFWFENLEGDLAMHYRNAFLCKKEEHLKIAFEDINNELKFREKVFKLNREQEDKALREHHIVRPKPKFAEMIREDHEWFTAENGKRYRRLNLEE